MEPVIIWRSLFERLLALCGITVGMFGAVLFIHSGLPIPGFAVAAILLIFGVRRLRASVVMNADALIVRNDVRTYHLRWTDVRDIRISSEKNRRMDVFGFFCVASIDCSSRRTVSVGVTSTLYQSREEAEGKAGAIYSQWRSRMGLV